MSLRDTFYWTFARGSSDGLTSDSVRFSDYLINVPKLKPRLAAIYDVEEDVLQCTWNRGQYQVKADKEIFQLNPVRPAHESASTF